MIMTNSMLIAQSMTNAFYAIHFTQSVPYQIYITGFVTNDSYTINKTCILHNKKIPNTIKSNVMQFTLLIHMHFISLVNVRVHVTRNHLIILIISFNKKSFSVVIFLAIFHDHIKEIQKRWGYQFFCQKSFLKDLICLYVTRHFFYYRIKNFQHKALFYQKNLNLSHKV